MSTVKISKRRPFSAVPDALLENRSLTPLTRLVGAWLAGRPDGWEIRVSHVRKTLGISQHLWDKAKRQLIEHGYFVQRRVRNSSGKFVWEHEFSDEPVFGGSAESSEESTISENFVNGEAANGKSINEKLGNIPILDNQEESTNNKKHSGSGGSNSRNKLSEKLDLSLIDPDYQGRVAALLDRCGLFSDEAQMVVDEWTGAIKERSGTDDPIRKPIPYLSALISRAQDGTMTPDHAPREQQVRLGLIDPDSGSESASDTAPGEAQALQRQLRQEWEGLFDTHFWPQIWKKHDKQNARKAWNKLCPSTPEEAQPLFDAIMAGAERYKAFLAANPDRSVKYPQGWLNGRRWEDEFDQQDLNGGAQASKPPSAFDRIMQSMREFSEAEGFAAPTPGQASESDQSLALFEHGNERF
ncbi:MAG TPA: hypothetical protein VK971_04400 [Thiohalobacter sp.]|nr:hypothetical protein [Thiohalobacter sp.]